MSGLTGRSIVHSTRSMPGYMSQYVSDGAADGREVDLLWRAVQEAAAMPNSSRPAMRGVVPLSAVGSGRLDAGVPHFHDRSWEAALRRRHDRRVDNEPRVSEQDKRAVASTRRRLQFVAPMGGATEAERGESNQGGEAGEPPSTRTAWWPERRNTGSSLRVMGAEMRAAAAAEEGADQGR